MMVAAAFAPYRKIIDLDRMRALASRCWRIMGPDAQVHPGNLCWRLGQIDAAERGRNVGLWTWRGDLVGFAVIHRQAPADLLVDPTWMDQTGLVRQMATWVCQRTDQIGGQAAAAMGPGLGCLLNTAERARILTDMGFRPGLRCYQRMLLEPISGLEPCAEAAQADLPPLAGHAALGPWLALYRRVFQYSPLTEAGLKRVRASPGYQPRLSRVAVDADRRPVAFVIAWLDLASKSVELEPVGCDPLWRRRGLTRALVRDALSLAAAQGATRASLTTRSDDLCAIRFYERCGFRPYALEREFMPPNSPVAV
jgi:ribosomal protein S18 acetylase RimI-like enzyme